MKKVLKIGLLIFALMNLLVISAFAASGVTENGTQNWSYTATLDGSDKGITIHSGDMFLLIGIKASSVPVSGGFPTSLTADAISYIDQKTAGSDDVTHNTIVFSGFIPMDYTGGTVFVTGGSLTGPTAVGTIQGHGVLGDVNDSKTVSSTDAKYILQYVAGSRTFDATQLSLGDVNGANGVTSTDAKYILQYVVGKRDADFKLVD